MADAIIAFISNMTIAMSNCSLYGKDHPAVMSLSASAVSLLEGLFAPDTFSVALIGDKIVVNDQPLATRNIHVSGFTKKLRRKGIDKIVISRGVTAAELKNFVVEISLSEKISGSYPHIVSGIIEVNLSGGAGGGDAGTVMEGNIAKIQDVYQDFSRFKRLDMVGLEDVVGSFISTVRQEANLLKVVSPVKAHSEYTYTHNANVAVISIFQAEALGMQQDILHDIGMAGLLHDIGKMFVPVEILEKETKLNEEEWKEMKKHPSYGAMYLATLPEVPKFALIAAYEHHMKFSGQGYPSPGHKGKPQHIISQIVAVADFFDALRTDRPYRKALDLPVIIGLMKETSGTDFNPLLIDNFIRALSRAGIFSLS